MDARIRSDLTGFIVDNYLFGDTTRAPGVDDSLVEGGIVDSTGILELIEYLESQFGIEVAETETIPENLDTIARMTHFVSGKQTVLESA